MKIHPSRQSTLPDDAGLTLLELLVVVTILVLLTVSIGTVALNYLDRAKVDTAKLQLNQIEAALDLYRLDLARYPSDAEGLDALVSDPGGEPKWRGPYLKNAATLEDPWGTAFQYRPPRGEQALVLFSFGADGTEGGTGDAADITLR